MVVVPLLWTVMQSFKTSQEFFADPWALPGAFNFNNYASAWEKANMSAYFMNSVYVTLVSTAFLMILAVPTSYCLARFKFFGGELIMLAMTLGLFIQPAYILVPLFLLVAKLNLLNNLTALSLIYAIIQLPFSIFILTGFIKGVSKEYEEAAEIDGCTRLQTIRHVVLPMIKPGMLTVLIFNFMGFWNEYAMAFTLLTMDNKKTLPVGLQNLMEVQRFSTDWGALFAGMVIVIIPTVIVYAFLNKKLTEAVNVGGLKG
ncbi:carbohydrate ABC transporter permease [Romboutsia ilealis]|uniref:Carbohydrate ABC transporter permease n=2 Tax=Romboutsia faecis TaxID=2764597 RepID=A0ABR7JKD3_9FIRM|nr:carbohydrate ABC transporter permease [Romboutsia faecis]MRN24539.1 carbohydrate ABC transporter permease [Romboutsia ilealis]